MQTVFLILLLETQTKQIEQIREQIHGLNNVELGIIGDEKEFVNALHHINFDLILANYHLSSQFKKTIKQLLEEKELDIPIQYLLKEPVSEKIKIELLKSGAQGVFLYQEQIKIFHSIFSAFEDKQKKNFDYRLYQELEDRKKLYESLLETIPDVIYRIDENGYFSYVSTSISRFGYIASDLVGKHYSLLFFPEDFEEISRQTVLPRYQGKKTGLDLSPKLFDERRSAPRNTKNLEIKIRTKSAQEAASSWVEIHSSGNYARGSSIKVEKNEKNKAVWVEIASIGQYDKAHHDQFVGTVGIIRDISEQKEGEKKFHLLFSRHASIILIIDPLNRAQIMDANHAALRFYGCSKDELLSKSLFDLIEGDKEDVLNKLESALKGNVDTLQVTQILCDGNKKTVELSTSPVQIKQKNCLFCVVQDISAKKEALDALEESRTYIEEFMSSTSDMIFLGEIKTGNLLYANKAALKNTGYSLEEITRMNHLDLHPQEKHAQYSRFFSDFARKGDFHPHEILLLTKGGEVILCEISGGTFVQQKRKIAFVVFRDIRERKAIEQRLKEQRDALRKSNYQLEQFAYAASHDLREPLRMVQSFLGILKDQYQDNLDETAHEYIHYAQEGAKRMDSLIADLLSFSRLTYQDAVRQEVNLAVVIKHALENLKVLLEESGAVISLPPLEYKLEGDPSRLMRLFQNLIENAVKFCDKAHAQIEIQVEDAKEEWVVHVKDNGIGIGPEFFGRIFKIFQRLHPRHVYQGTGIGLAVCQKIVEQHGGKIWVDSQLGQGSTFSFTLKKSHAGAPD